MANEIYDNSWFGNTIDTSSSIGTSTEMIQGQFNLTKLGDEEVVNGDFATDSDWIKGSGWSIEDGVASLNAPTGNLDQSLSASSGSKYIVTFTISNYVSGDIRWRFTGASNENGTLRSANGTYEEEITLTNSQSVFRFPATAGIMDIDNVSVKKVRATTVEAKKCLADAIHKIGIQNIQN